MFFEGETCRQNAHKNFSGKLGKFGQRSFAPPKIWLFLHLCRRNPFYCALISLRQNLLFLSPLAYFQGTLETYEMFPNTLILVFIDPTEKVFLLRVFWLSLLCQNRRQNVCNKGVYVYPVNLDVLEHHIKFTIQHLQTVIHTTRKWIIKHLNIFSQIPITSSYLQIIIFQRLLQTELGFNHCHWMTAIIRCVAMKQMSGDLRVPNWYCSFASDKPSKRVSNQRLFNRCIYSFLSRCHLKKTWVNLRLRQFNE